MQPRTVSTLGISSSSLLRMDTWASAQTVLQVNVTGTATYTVQTSMDDPNDPNNPVTTMTWVNATDPNVVGQTASATGILTATPVFIRLNQTAGNGSCTMTVAQFGAAPY